MNLTSASFFAGFVSTDRLMLDIDLVDVHGVFGPGPEVGLLLLLLSILALIPLAKNLAAV